MISLNFVLILYTKKSQQNQNPRKLLQLKKPPSYDFNELQNRL